LRRDRGTESLARVPQQLLEHGVVCLIADLERDKGLDDLACHRVGLADHAGFGHCRMLHERAFDFEWADQMP
jgi:hypothetical protein